MAKEDRDKPSLALPSAKDQNLLPASPVEEKKLPASTRISEDTFGMYEKDLKKEKMLSRDEEKELGKKIKYGNPTERIEAINKLVRANLRFVVKTALGFDKSHNITMDLINEGNTGLIQAASRFDPDYGTKFISYAVWWIRQKMLQYIYSNQKIAYMPYNRAAKLRKLLKSSREQGLDIEHSQMTIKEMADMLDVDIRDIEESYQYAQKDISLDPSSPYFKDSLQSSYLSPEESYLKQAEEQEINKLMRDLTDREQLVLKKYFGLQDNTPCSLEKIGQELGVSRERIRQIKDRALVKLRQSPKSEKLKDLLGVIND
ncbi:RNA polymerase sigma factor RpoD/SigA [candidate division WOR-3 bacterium]|nr:RNA polymerase sigma factor RpoD/SigA [candidate division WOR-3 bacterium]